MILADIRWLISQLLLPPGAVDHLVGDIHDDGLFRLDSSQHGQHDPVDCCTTSRIRSDGISSIFFTTARARGTASLLASRRAGGNSIIRSAAAFRNRIELTQRIALEIPRRPRKSGVSNEQIQLLTDDCCRLTGVSGLIRAS